MCFIRDFWTARWDKKVFWGMGKSSFFKDTPGVGMGLYILFTTVTAH
jgi:hypothetical protein